MTTWRLGHRPALDGLRGMAVLLVVVGHFGLAPFSIAGAIGVKMFFALSGFLITSLLMEEYQRAGRISLRGFYARRARRLLPALAALVMGLYVLELVGFPIRLGLATVISVALYFSNWYLIASAHGGTIQWGWLGNTWSLAIEEQFYLIWPLLLLIVARWRRGVLVLASVSAVMSLGWWALTDRPEQATDVAAYGLLAGCALAAAMHAQPVRRITPTWPALGVLLFLPFIHSQAWNEVYVATPLLTVAAIWVGAQRSVTWLEFSWLRWVGIRSYGLYLWHFPIVVLCEPVRAPWAIVAPIGIAASFGVTILSWTYVESPFLRRRRSTSGVVGGEARVGEFGREDQRLVLDAREVVVTDRGVPVAHDD